MAATAPRATDLPAPVVVVPTGNAELAGLVKRRAELEAAIDDLRASKPTLAPEHDRSLEKLLLGWPSSSADCQDQSALQLGDL